MVSQSLVASQACSLSINFAGVRRICFIGLCHLLQWVMLVAGWRAVYWGGRIAACMLWCIVQLQSEFDGRGHWGWGMLRISRVQCLPDVANLAPRIMVQLGPCCVLPEREILCHCVNAKLLLGGQMAEMR